jgi:hypothetical protein
MKPFRPLPPPHGKLQKTFNYNLQRGGGDISKMFAAACGVKIRFPPLVWNVELNLQLGCRVSPRN